VSEEMIEGYVDQHNSQWPLVTLCVCSGSFSVKQKIMLRLRRWH